LLDRLFLLDAQPFCDCSGMSSSELKNDIRLSIFMSSICHTLLVVTDTSMDYQLLKFLRVVATLKAKIPDLALWMERQGNSNDLMEVPADKEVLPRLVVVFNNLTSKMDEGELSDVYQKFLDHSLWKHAPSIQFLRVPTLPGTSLSGLLTSEAAHQAGLQLRERVLSEGPERGRFGKDSLQLTEREWLYHLSGYLDFVQNSPVIQEYVDAMSHGFEQYGWM